jgi:hypothetical protein
MNRGLEYARAIKKASRAQQEHAQQTKQRRRDIIANPELTPEQKAVALERLQKEGLARHHKFGIEIEKLQKRADAWTNHVRVNRSVDETARSRVRELLERGVPAQEQIARAVEIGDSEHVAALRAEMRWFGDKSGFADTADTIHACDLALAQIGRGGEDDVNDGLVQIAEANKSVADISVYSGKVALGQDKPIDTLTVAYATGEGRESDA